MEVSPFLPLPEGLGIADILAEETTLTVSVISMRSGSCCPLCAQESSQVHSRYQRSLRDVSCGGRSITLHLRVRKFFCRNPTCSRKIFTERLPSFVEPWARMTLRHCQALQAIGVATCGELGARLAERLALPTSPTTVLRRIMALPVDPPGLGIDDFALRRGRKYGTVLVDLTRHRVIDLLPDRKAETAKAWIQSHPEIKVISRDRGGDYATAAAQGAPEAIQSADRFHLVKNLTEAVEKALVQCRAEWRKAQKAKGTAGPQASEESPPPECGGGQQDNKRGEQQLPQNHMSVASEESLQHVRPMESDSHDHSQANPCPLLTSDGQPYSAHQAERYDRYLQVVARL